MDKKPIGVMKGCAIGCGVIGAILILGMIGISVRTWMPLRSSGKSLSLLESEMGLGEYSYIFAVAYREQFRDEAIHEELFSEDGPVSPEAAATLRAILAHQRDAQGGEPEDRERRDLIERELEALAGDPQRLPWQDELPGALLDSLSPYQERLDAAFCRSSAGIAMDHDSGRALAIALE